MRNQKIIIVNGMARSGKDTFISFIKEFHGNLVQWSTIDPEKGILNQMIGRPYNPKNENDRLFLSEFKQLLNERYNYTEVQYRKWLDWLEREEDFPTYFATISREPKEIARLKQLAVDRGFPCLAILIRNDKIRRITTNNSDLNCENYDYDYTIFNHGTLEEFKEKAKEFYVEKLL